MKRLLLLAALIGMAFIAFAPTATAQPAPGPADGVCEGVGEGDPDCAAALLEAAENGDGGFTAPAAQYSEEPVTSCSQFTTYATGEFSQYQAQQYFDFLASPAERELLDPDGNGFACDTPPAEAPSASESYTALPDTGGPALLMPVAALLIGAGILGVAILRRR